jgi:hypothetical protein
MNLYLTEAHAKEKKNMLYDVCYRKEKEDNVCVYVDATQLKNRNTLLPSIFT